MTFAPITTGTRRTIALALIPLVALPSTAFLLRWGAPGPVHAARIEAAPPDRQGELAWQMVVAVEERGVREAVAMNDVDVTLHGKFGERTWHGDTNKDGVAEIHWDNLSGVATGDTLDLEVHHGAERLAYGPVAWPAAALVPARSFTSLLLPSKREGQLALDVAISGTRLVAGFAVPVWVRVIDATTKTPVAGAALAFTAEPGVELSRTQATTCSAGWAQLSATAIMHVAELGIEAHAGDNAGSWHGNLPVAPGASFVALPPNVDADKSTNVDVLLVGARELEYLEIDDDHGRVFAASAALAVGAEGRRHASIAIPPLHAGPMWLVTSGDPHGATKLAGATLARPFNVTAASATGSTPSTKLDACSGPAEAAALATTAFPRFLALDGFAQSDRAPDLRRAKTAKLLATALLTLAGMLETMLLAVIATEARRRIAAIEGATTTSLARTFVLIACAWLGFAFFAALIWIRG